MDVSLATDAQSGVLSATLTGAFTPAEAERTFLEVLSAAAQGGAQRILMDGEAVTGTPHTFDRFKYGEFVANSIQRHENGSALRACRFAYVLKAPVLDSRRFGETVAVNRGAWARVFDNRADALAWLVASGVE